MHHQENGYFGLIVIGNFGNQVLQNPLIVSDLKNLEKNVKEVQHFYDRLHSDMTAKSIEGSITKTSLNKRRPGPVASNHGNLKKNCYLT